MGIGKQVVSNCVVQYLSFLEFIPHGLFISYYLLLLLLLLIIFYIVSTLKLF